MASVTPYCGFSLHREKRGTEISQFMIVYVCFQLLYHNSFKMISDTKLFVYSFIVYVLLSSKNQHKQQLVHHFLFKWCLQCKLDNFVFVQFDRIESFTHFRRVSEYLTIREQLLYGVYLFYCAMYNFFPIRAWFCTLQICQTLMWLSKTGRGRKSRKGSSHNTNT